LFSGIFQILTVSTSALAMYLPTGSNATPYTAD
jgi:hypothetical protein